MWSFFRQLPFVMPCPTVGTVHDLSTLHMAEKYDRAHTFYIRRVLPTLIRRLTHVITVSQSSLHDIVDYAGVPEDCVTVIPNGVDVGHYHPLSRDEVRTALQGWVPLDAPYIVYVSRIEHPGKNHVRLIEAFARLKKGTRLAHRLVLAGPDRERAAEVHDAAASSGVASDIVFTGFVSDDRLPAIYAGADMLVFPSLYEGFGIPVLESMACEVPVACSQTSSLPEVAGDAAVLFDPCDVEAMAHAMEQLLTIPQLRASCVHKGTERVQRFSWDTVARLTLGVIEQVAGGKFSDTLL